MLFLAAPRLVRPPHKGDKPERPSHQEVVGCWWTAFGDCQKFAEKGHDNRAVAARRASAVMQHEDLGFWPSYPSYTRLPIPISQHLAALSLAGCNGQQLAHVQTAVTPGLCSSSVQQQSCCVVHSTSTWL